MNAPRVCPAWKALAFLPQHGRPGKPLSHQSIGDRFCSQQRCSWPDFQKGLGGNRRSHGLVCPDADRRSDLRLGSERLRDCAKPLSWGSDGCVESATRPSNSRKQKSLGINCPYSAINEPDLVAVKQAWESANGSPCRVSLSYGGSWMVRCSGIAGRKAGGAERRE